MTVFAATGLARTFNYQAGDVGIAPVNTAHDIENRGDTPLRLLAIFRSDHYADVSLNQWLALIPPELVREHLHLSDHTLAALSKQKRLIVKERDQSIWGTLRIPSTRSFAARYAVSCPPHRPNTAPRVSEVHPGYTYR